MKSFNLKLQEPIVFFLALGLSLFGLLMSFDAAYPRAIAAGHGILPPEFRSQLLLVLIGPLVYLLVTKISIVWLKRLGFWAWAITLLLLLAAWVSPLRYEMNGAERWVKLGPLVLQPAEFAKLTVILYLGAIYATNKISSEPKRKNRDWAAKLDHEVVPKLGQFIPAILVGFGLYLIDKEPDLGTAAVVGASAVAIFWLGGVSAKTLAIGAAILAMGAIYVIKAEPYRYDRFINHAQRWEPQNIEGSGYQTDQSEVALANGGLFGKGIGEGHAKHVLPAATTDFVMATVGEEFGLLGTLTILTLLGALAVRLAFVGMESLGRGDGYSSMILGGVAAWIGVQGCINLLQANATLPPIGIPFPFVSSGGSSLLALWIALGVCEASLRGAAQKAAAKEVEAEDSSHGRRDRRTHLSRA